MFNPDKQRFSELLDEMGVIYEKKEVPATLKKLYWEDLEQFPMAAIEAAFKAHRRDPERGRFFPKIADLIARIGNASHIPADSAWAIALESMDEDRTILWTDEIERAREAARPIWDIGDKYGARLAFVKAYEAILLSTSTPPRYKVSIGNDPAQRQDVVMRAVQDGLLTHERAQAYLPAPDITPAGQAIAGLLTGKVVDLPQDNATKARLEALRAALQRKPAASKEAEERREVIEARRREALDYLSERMAQA